MSESEAATLLVDLMTTHEYLRSKCLYSTNSKYSKAVAMAIMALEQYQHRTKE